jgi:hypothetical protein
MVNFSLQCGAEKRCWGGTQREQTKVLIGTGGEVERGQVDGGVGRRCRIYRGLFEKGRRSNLFA